MRISLNWMLMAGDLFWQALSNFILSATNTLHSCQASTPSDLQNVRLLIDILMAVIRHRSINNPMFYFNNSFHLLKVKGWFWFLFIDHLTSDKEDGCLGLGWWHMADIMTLLMTLMAPMFRHLPDLIRASPDISHLTLTNSYSYNWSAAAVVRKAVASL